MPSFSISVVDEATLSLDGFSNRLSDLRTANEIAGEYFLGQIDERFRTETDPDRRPWRPLSTRTVAQKRAEGRILKILQKTGFMRSTANYNATSSKVTIGLSASYADRHQRGIGVPQRRILGVNRDDIANLQEIYTDYVFDE